MSSKVRHVRPEPVCRRFAEAGIKALVGLAEETDKRIADALNTYLDVIQSQNPDGSEVLPAIVPMAVIALYVKKHNLRRLPGKTENYIEIDSYMNDMMMGFLTPYLNSKPKLLNILAVFMSNFGLRDGASECNKAAGYDLLTTLETVKQEYKQSK